MCGRGEGAAGDLGEESGCGLTPTRAYWSGPGKEGEQELAVLPQAPPRLFAYAA